MIVTARKIRAPIMTFAARRKHTEDTVDVATIASTTGRVTHSAYK